jgi:hypothetical protein
MPKYRSPGVSLCHSRLRLSSGGPEPARLEGEGPLLDPHLRKKLVIPLLLSVLAGSPPACTGLYDRASAREGDGMNERGVVPGVGAR